MDYEPYGKMREPKRRRAKNMNEKKESEEPKGFFERFDGKHVRVKLLTGDTLEGFFKSNSYNKYDCLLFQEDKPILLPKHAIGFVEAIKKENQNEPNR